MSLDEQIAEAMRAYLPGFVTAVGPVVREIVAGAVAEEREACAQIALGNTCRDDFPWHGDVRDIADAIRARNQTLAVAYGVKAPRDAPPAESKGGLE